MAEYTGFRADLWRRIDQWVFSHRISSLDDIQSIDLDGIWLTTGHLYSWLSMGVDEASVRAIFNRWRAYQRVLAEDVLWRDGSDERAERLVAEMEREGPPWTVRSATFMDTPAYHETILDLTECSVLDAVLRCAAMWDELDRADRRKRMN